MRIESGHLSFGMTSLATEFAFEVWIWDLHMHFCLELEFEGRQKELGNGSWVRSWLELDFLMIPLFVSFDFWILRRWD